MPNIRIPVISMSTLLPYSLGATAIGNVIENRLGKERTHCLKMCVYHFRNAPQTISAAFIGVAFFGTGGALAAGLAGVHLFIKFTKLMDAMENEDSRSLALGLKNKSLTQYDETIDRVASFINLAGAGYMLWLNPVDTLTRINAAVQLVNVL